MPIANEQKKQVMANQIKSAILPNRAIKYQTTIESEENKAK